ncbi:gamma-glutamylcyclotransferase family protein [Gramella sp. AN32]|uniref:Putative gamma-glutamylcyclotransferase n=1 Tax=Christiangramia antarctica TaxID=2058158 RepID=A0ABW5X2G6_9FLAO|nr:gamma-glutamylcyclotransferase family protein [Gramella sp. AN32]MCM4155178.1 hypothetical protein [Gramella sp. AN32]
MPKLFAYGTLQDEKLQQKLFGKILKGKPAILKGYHLGKITIPRNETGSIYPAIRISENDTDKVFGYVYDISDDEMEIATDYEGDDYNLVEATLECGTKAKVFIVD